MLNGWTSYPEKSRRIRSITRELMQAKEGRDSRFHAVNFERQDHPRFGEAI
jgi:hypothetical protein